MFCPLFIYIIYYILYIHLVLPPLVQVRAAGVEQLAQLEVPRLGGIVMILIMTMMRMMMRMMMNDE